MTAVYKLTIAAICLLIANKLDSVIRTNEQAALCQAAKEDDAQVSKRCEKALLAATHIKKNYPLRDSQRQRIERAIQMIADVANYLTVEVQLENIKKADSIIVSVYEEIV